MTRDEELRLEAERRAAAIDTIDERNALEREAMRARAARDEALRDEAVERAAALRNAAFESRRSHWPGVLAALIIGAGIAAFAVSSYYDHRTIGERIDAGVATAEHKVEALKSGAGNAAADGARATDGVASKINDAAITAAVKTALAADPALSALKINVTTENGVVKLEGPAPDEKARERAAVLAAAPQGVQRVDNQLTLPNG